MINIPGEVITFLLAMTPVGELRVAIPAALTIYGLDPLSAYIISVSGNIFAVFLILTCLGSVSKWLSHRFYIFNRFFAWLFTRTKKNHFFRVQKYGLFALTAFVAIPLPITGGWTGSLIAFVFNIPFKRAFPLISLGLMIAGLIVLFTARTGIAIHSYFGWQVLLGSIFAIIASYVIYGKIRKDYNRHI